MKNKKEDLKKEDSEKIDVKLNLIAAGTVLVVTPTCLALMGAYSSLFRNFGKLGIALTIIATFATIYSSLFTYYLIKKRSFKKAATSFKNDLELISPRPLKESYFPNTPKEDEE